MNLYYSFFYDNLSGEETYRVISSDVFIPNFQTIASISEASTLESSYPKLHTIYQNKINVYLLMMMVKVIY